LVFTECVITFCLFNFIEESNSFIELSVFELLTGKGQVPATVAGDGGFEISWQISGFVVASEHESSRPAA